MKLLYTLLALALSCSSSLANIWNVTVADFSFNPSTVNAVVGDVITFTWASGFHTTTCGSGLPGTTLPAGAAEWNEPIDPGYTSFSYTVTVAGNYFYGCIPHFSGGGGMSGNIIVSGTVPVALGIFNVSITNNLVTLNWDTHTEVNTHYFSIRKSTDGTRFSEIGRVNAAGNSTLARKYNFIDHNPGKTFKYLYYELVTVDLDLKENHSPIKLVKNPDLKDQLIVALSPNPVTSPGQLRVLFNADKNGLMEVRVVNMEGKQVLAERMAAFYGLNNAHLHMCGLSKGIYTIRFELENQHEARKIVVK